MDKETLEALKADADAKLEAYQEARVAYDAAVCAQHHVQPGELIAVDMGRRVKVYRVKRLENSYGRVAVYAAEILSDGKESHVERRIWRDYRKHVAEDTQG